MCASASPFILVKCPVLRYGHSTICKSYIHIRIYMNLGTGWLLICEVSQLPRISNFLFGNSILTCPSDSMFVYLVKQIPSSSIGEVKFCPHRLPFHLQPDCFLKSKTKKHCEDHWCEKQNKRAQARLWIHFLNWLYFYWEGNFPPQVNQPQDRAVRLQRLDEGRSI